MKAKRLLTDPNLPGVWIVPAERTYAKLAEGVPNLGQGGPAVSTCPFRPGHPCHVPKNLRNVKIDTPCQLPQRSNFETCLICTLNEIRRELELRRLG